MRSSLAALLMFFALPLAGTFAQHAHVHSSAGCGCGRGCGAATVVPAVPTCGSCAVSAPVVACGSCAVSAPVVACGTCNICDTCGGDACSSCGQGLCSNWSAFYETLYAEFYAKNAWYVEHRKREAAARRARMMGQDPDAAIPPAKTAEPIKPAANKAAEQIKAPEPK